MPLTGEEQLRACFPSFRLDQIEDGLKQEIQAECRVNIESCLECGKCSGGCSYAHGFDFTPRKIIQLIKYGQEDRLLKIDALWTCLSCHLCVDRCPAGIDIPRIMDYLREKADRNGIQSPRSSVRLFYKLMLNEISGKGRVGEAGLMIRYNIESKQWFKDADLGRRMFFKGKLKLLGTRVKGREQIKHIFRSTENKERDKA